MKIGACYFKRRGAEEDSELRRGDIAAPLGADVSFCPSAILSIRLCASAVENDRTD